MAPGKFHVTRSCCHCFCSCSNENAILTAYAADEKGGIRFRHALELCQRVLLGTFPAAQPCFSLPSKDSRQALGLQPLATLLQGHVILTGRKEALVLTFWQRSPWKQPCFGQILIPTPLAPQGMDWEETQPPAPHPVPPTHTLAGRWQSRDWNCPFHKGHYYNFCTPTWPSSEPL
jgi:hypothetical protein